MIRYTENVTKLQLIKNALTYEYVVGFKEAMQYQLIIYSQYFYTEQDKKTIDVNLSYRVDVGARRTSLPDSIRNSKTI